MALMLNGEEDNDGPSMSEQEMREANMRHYDSIDKREEINEKREAIAGKVIDRIKHFKKMVKHNIR